MADIVLLSEPMSQWRPGEQIEKRWDVQEVLEGGCGVVYVVFDQKFRRQLAVKTFKDTTTPVIDQAAFVRESTAWIRLDHHPNVVQAYFALQLLDRPHLFLEYVPRGDLRHWIISAENRHRLREGLRLAIEICDGLSHIYAYGIAAHRDIKPENFLLSADGQLKVTDFGLASMQAPHRSLSTTGLHTEPGGTPAYMPPEQFFLGSVGKSADVYAFGLVLFELLTGRHPLADWLGPYDEPWQWARVHQTVIPDLEHAGIPARLQILLERCLAKDSRNRFSGFETIRSILAEEYRARAGIAIPCPPVRQLDSTELGLKAAGLFEIGFADEATECVLRILALEEPQDELYLCYERVVSLLELFTFNNPGWRSGIGPTLLCGLAPGRALIKEPVPGFPETLELLENILRNDPKHSSALEMKARLLLIGGRYKSALAAFRDAIKSKPADHGWKDRLTALPIYHIRFWTQEVPHQPDSDFNIVECYRIAAELGHTRAKYELGLLYLRGKGVEQSMFQAFVWLVLAARAGYSQALAPLEDVYNFLQKDEYFQLDSRRPSALAHAKHNLGSAYYFGNGTDQDYSEAANWFREAADMGSADSRYNLGLMYKTGRGVVKDLAVAYYWLHLAALQGDKNALAMRDSLTAEMSPAQMEAASALVKRGI